jgi:GTP pyrophosphokinase
VALRVVVSSVEECYRVLGIIHSIWNPLPGRIKDYVAVPKPNGYRSIHTTIFTGSGGIAEIQIRTKEMHAEAAYGIAAHFAYKEKDVKNKIDNDSKFKWIEELRDLNHNTDDSINLLEHLKMDFFNDRIFIFTPKGDVIDLPDGSCTVDFAYSIHSAVGDHIFGAKINGKMSQIFTKLKNGDIVEIVTKKDAHPSSKWLDNVKTTIAKKHIKSYLEKNSLIAKLKSFGRT